MPRTVAKAKQINVSRTALYDKLNRMEPGVSAALVRQTALQMTDAISQLEAQLASLLDGYRLRILDGTCLAATDHRIKPLRP